MPVYALGDLEPRIHPGAYIHPDAVIIGDVEVGEGSSVWPAAVIRGDDAPIVIGARTSIQDGTVVHTTPYSPTRVGDDCVVGHNAHLEGCHVLDGALVGSGSIVLHRAVVEPGALVGAGAVVPGGMVVPTGAMALGVPARIKPGAVDGAEAIAPAARSYLERVARYRRELRRLQ